MSQSAFELHEIEPDIIQVTMQDRVQRNTFSEELVATDGIE